MGKIGAKATPSGEPSEPVGVRISNDHYLERFRALISGPPGSGKTFCAATMSEFWPEELTIFDKPYILEDMLWISVDAGALSGLGQFNIGVREISLLEDLMCPPLEGDDKFYVDNLIRAMVIAYSSAKSLVLQRKVKTIVLDSASQLNFAICAYWADEARRPRDNLAYWGRVKDTEATFYPKLLSLPCNVIVLSHEKPVMDGIDSARKRLEALTPEGSHSFALAISGGALGNYYQTMDIAATLMANKKPGKNKNYARSLHPWGFAGRDGKCRFQHLMSLEEEAHLQKLYQRMKARKTKEDQEGDK